MDRCSFRGTICSSGRVKRLNNSNSWRGIKMRKKAMLLTAIVFLSLPLFALHIVNAQQTNSPDEHIAVQEFFGGFTSYQYPGSFNASSGNYVGVDLSVSSSDNHQWEIEVQIVGTTSGVVYDVRASGFAETFQINNDDTYNITLIKRSPFYVDLTVSGEITIYHRSVPLVTNPPSPSPVPTPKPTLSLSPYPSSSTTSDTSPSPNVSPSPTVPTFLLVLTLTAVIIATIVAVVGLLVYFKKHKH